MRGRGTDHFTLDKANVLFDAYVCVFWVYPHIWRSGSQEPSILPLRQGLSVAWNFTKQARLAGQ